LGKRSKCFFVKKEIKDKRTVTRVKVLEGDERIEECPAASHQSASSIMPLLSNATRLKKI